jgi:hypothetical protein
LGTVPAAIGWVFLIGDAVSVPEGPGVEGWFVLACLVALSAAALLTWHRPRRGAWAEIAAAVAFGAVVLATAGSNRVAVALLLPLPWLLSGLALLLLDEREGRPSNADKDKEAQTP